MTERKCCETCKKPLLAMKGFSRMENGNTQEAVFYLHPDSPCSGITDAIYIEAVIEDEALNSKFVEMYGNPKLSDYEMVELLEKQVKEKDKIITLFTTMKQGWYDERDILEKNIKVKGEHIDLLKKELETKELLLNKPLIKFLLKLGLFR